MERIPPSEACPPWRPRRRSSVATAEFVPDKPRRLTCLPTPAAYLRLWQFALSASPHEPICSRATYTTPRLVWKVQLAFRLLAAPPADAHRECENVVRPTPSARRVVLCRRRGRRFDTCRTGSAYVPPRAFSKRIRPYAIASVAKASF